MFIDKTKTDPSFPDVYKYHFPPFHRDRNKKGRRGNPEGEG